MRSPWILLTASLRSHDPFPASSPTCALRAPATSTEAVFRRVSAASYHVLSSDLHFFFLSLSLPCPNLTLHGLAPLHVALTRNPPWRTMFEAIAHDLQRSSGSPAITLSTLLPNACAHEDMRHLTPPHIPRGAPPSRLQMNFRQLSASELASGQHDIRQKLTCAFDNDVRPDRRPLHHLHCTTRLT